MKSSESPQIFPVAEKAEAFHIILIMQNQLPVLRSNPPRGVDVIIYSLIYLSALLALHPATSWYHISSVRKTHTL